MIAAEEGYTRLSEWLHDYEKIRAFIAEKSSAVQK